MLECRRGGRGSKGSHRSLQVGHLAQTYLSQLSRVARLWARRDAANGDWVLPPGLGAASGGGRPAVKEISSASLVSAPRLPMVRLSS